MALAFIVLFTDLLDEQLFELISAFISAIFGVLRKSLLNSCLPVEVLVNNAVEEHLINAILVRLEVVQGILCWVHGLI